MVYPLVRWMPFVLITRCASFFCHSASKYDPTRSRIFSQAVSPRTYLRAILCLFGPTEAVSSRWWKMFGNSRQIRRYRSTLSMQTCPGVVCRFLPSRIHAPVPILAFIGFGHDSQWLFLWLALFLSWAPSVEPHRSSACLGVQPLAVWIECYVYNGVQHVRSKWAMAFGLTIMTGAGNIDVYWMIFVFDVFDRWIFV